MKCPNKKKITAYIDNGIGKKEKDIIKKHMSECDRCRLSHERIQENIEFLKEKTKILDPEMIPAFEDVIEKKVNTTVNSEKSVRKPGRFFYLKPVIGATAVIVLGVFLVLFITDSNILKKKNVSGSSPDNSQYHSVIKGINVKGKKGQAFIIDDRSTKTRFIWVEKGAN